MFFFTFPPRDPLSAAIPAGREFIILSRDVETLIIRRLFSAPPRLSRDKPELVIGVERQVSGLASSIEEFSLPFCTFDPLTK